MVCTALPVISITYKGDTTMADQIEELLAQLTYEQKLKLFEYLERRTTGAALPRTQASA